MVKSAWRNGKKGGKYPPLWGGAVIYYWGWGTVYYTTRNKAVASIKLTDIPPFVGGIFLYVYKCKWKIVYTNLEFFDFITVSYNSTFFVRLLCFTESKFLIKIDVHRHDFVLRFGLCRNGGFFCFWGQKEMGNNVLQIGKKGYRRAGNGLLCPEIWNNSAEKINVQNRQISKSGFYKMFSRSFAALQIYLYLWA